MTKIGLIGLGGMGSGHAKTLAGMPSVKVMWVCDLIRKKARAIGTEIGVKHCVDYRKWLDEVDAVWISTEPFNRVDIVTTCAKAGKHIWTEKPIARNLQDADKMIAAARKAKVVYMLGYCLRYWNPYRLIRDTFVSGELGDLVTCWTRRFMPCDMRGTWYEQDRKSGGVVLDFGSHDIDWLRWIGGDVKMVLGKTFRIRPNVKADEHANMMMIFKKGGNAIIDVSWSSYLSESSIGVIGTKGSMIVGADGKIRKKIGEKSKEQIIESGASVTIDPKGNLGKDPHASAQGENMYEHFFRCIREGLVPITSAEEGRKTLITCMAVKESGRRGKPVEPAEFGSRKKTKKRA